MPTAIEVTTPSRLHFGLLSFGDSGTRAFGGAGLMIERPGVRLCVSPADAFTTAGPLAARARSVVERWAAAACLPSLPACRVEILEAPAEHVGLGTGTQLALAVVAAIHAARGGDPLPPAVLATLTGRGMRSAVGTYGFYQGGLLVESGKLAGQLLAPLERRLEVPKEWRFLLVQAEDEGGLSGDAERGAFDMLPPVPRSTTAALLHELASELVPAVENVDFPRFAESLYRYGRTAGLCFAAKQGGPFASARIAQLAQTVRGLGAPGVAQSSWGPTVFVALPDAVSAERLAADLQARAGTVLRMIITEPNNVGARFARVELP